MKLSILSAAALAMSMAVTLTPGRAAYAPPKTVRTKTLLPGPWKFMRSDDLTGAEAPDFADAGWQTVNVPHIWNSRGDMKTNKACWYRTHIVLPQADAGKRIFLYFEGAATIADVYLNGTSLGEHRGAYTRFIFDATDAAHFGGDNVLAVKVSNDPKETADCLPAGNLNQLYHVYGGIYRKAWIVMTGPYHVDPTDMASSGVYITPGQVDANNAEFSIRTLLRNDSAARKDFTVHDTLCDKAGQVVGSWNGTASVDPHSHGEVTIQGKLDHPGLWAPGHPTLYDVYSEVSVDGAVQDVVHERTGFRSFTMTPEAFTLNGVNTPLRGVAKHQETEEKLTAVDDSDLVTDFDNLQELGVNFTRLPHYPHAELEYNLGDERGIILWCETGHSNNSPGTDTGDLITREMVRQNYNHPSIIFWSAGNESAGGPGTAANNRYASVIKSEDKTRLVTYANNGGFKAGPDLDFVSSNTYPGWYGGPDSTFENSAARSHYISETGGGGVITTHCDYADATHKVNTYEPEEYQQLLAESRCQVIFRTQAKEVQLFTWWAFRDFGDNKYKRWFNTKGLETINNYKKDSFYIFQSFLRPELPVLHITSKEYFLRQGKADNGIKVYSNRPSLTLAINGQPVGTQAAGQYAQPDPKGSSHPIDHVYYWNSPLHKGKNNIEVSDGSGHTDSCVVYFEGDGGLPESPNNAPLVQDLVSSNAANPAYFIDQPVQAYWPFFYDLDGTADNAFKELPGPVQGARWISTRRTSKAGNATDLSFTLAAGRGATVFIMATDNGTAVAPAGFTDTGLSGQWRDADTRLEAWKLYRKDFAGGEKVSIPGAQVDYVVLVKAR